MRYKSSIACGCKYCRIGMTISADWDGIMRVEDARNFVDEAVHAVGEIQRFDLIGMLPNETLANYVARLLGFGSFNDMCHNYTDATWTAVRNLNGPNAYAYYRALVAQRGFVVEQDFQ